LVAEDELRGRVRVMTPPPEPGTLGSVVEALAISLGPGGAATVLASALIAWIRRQRTNIKLKVVRADGSSTELLLDHVPLSGDDGAKLAEDLLRTLAERDNEPDGGRG
jgi:hypothetical protein